MRKRVWILGCLAVGLTGITLLGTGKESNWGRIAYTLPALSDLVELKIEQGADTLSLQKKQGKWLIFPGSHALDEGAQRDLSEAFVNPVVMDQALRSDTSEATRLGLGSNAPWITLKTNTTKTRFKMGRLVDGRHTFISPDGEEIIYRARANLPGVFARPIELWRNRTLFGREFTDMAAVQRKQGDRIIWRAERSDPKSKWRIVIPEGIDTGQQEVNAVANTLATLRADGFLQAIDDHEPTYAVFGEAFDGSTFGISLEPTNGPIIRGRSMPQGAFVELRRSRVSFLDAQVSDLRNRRLFDIKIDDVREVVIPRVPRLHLKRISGDEWESITAGRAVPTHRQRVEDFVEWLTQMRTAGFAANLPDDAFATSAEAMLIRHGKDRQTTLFLGAEYRNGARFARTNTRPGTVYILSPTALKQLGTDPDTFSAAP